MSGWYEDTEPDSAEAERLREQARRESWENRHESPELKAARKQRYVLFRTNRKYLQDEDNGFDDAVKVIENCTGHL